MPKGTSQTEVTSNSEKTKLVALAVIDLCLPEAALRTCVANEQRFSFGIIHLSEIAAKIYTVVS